MKLQWLHLLGILVILILCQGCASPYFLPRTRPLFAGLDETSLPVEARRALEQAKIDFQLARHGRPPQYARYISTIPNTESKVYRGWGYTLTLINGGLRNSIGPEIIIESSITGGDPFSYDEIADQTE